MRWKKRVYFCSLASFLAFSEVNLSAKDSAIPTIVGQSVPFYQEGLSNPFTGNPAALKVVQDFVKAEKTDQNKAILPNPFAGNPAVLKAVQNSTKPSPITPDKGSTDDVNSHQEKIQQFLNRQRDQDKKLSAGHSLVKKPHFDKRGHNPLAGNSNVLRAVQAVTNPPRVVFLATASADRINDRTQPFASSLKTPIEVQTYAQILRSQWGYGRFVNDTSSDLFLLKSYHQQSLNDKYKGLSAIFRPFVSFRDTWNMNKKAKQITNKEHALLDLQVKKEQKRLLVKEYAQKLSQQEPVKKGWFFGLFGAIKKKWNESILSWQKNRAEKKCQSLALKINRYQEIRDGLLVGLLKKVMPQSGPESEVNKSNIHEKLDVFLAQMKK